uniref:Uncharacterized protein n=1 Tax=Arundo donax TaxID=35708 RepID=A0A0A9F6K6_ARUDO
MSLILSILLKFLCTYVPVLDHLQLLNFPFSRELITHFLIHWQH